MNNLTGLNQSFSFIKNRLNKIFEIVANYFFFTAEVLRGIVIPPLRWRETIQHIEFIGNQSFFIVLLTGLFTGLALSFQVYLGFKIVNATNLIGPVVALGILRELGPVLTGLICAARAGGAMAARLATMRVSDQIDALNVMGVDAFNYLMGPRLVAALVTMPLLVALFDFFGLIGAWVLVSQIAGLDGAVFWTRIQSIVEIRHFFEGLIKGFVFGFVFTIVCCYNGWITTGGAKGVGNSTNKGVVISMVTIIILDYFLTNIIRIIYFFIF